MHCSEREKLIGMSAISFITIFFLTRWVRKHGVRWTAGMGVQGEIKSWGEGRKGGGGPGEGRGEAPGNRHEYSDHADGGAERN